MRTRIAMIVLVALLPVAAGAQGTGVPSLDYSRAQLMTDPGTGYFVLMIRPDGQGPGFDQARDQDGQPVDARVIGLVRDPLDYAIANFPHEDLWLRRAEGGTPTCFGSSFYGGYTFDTNSDAQGEALIFSAPRGGGYNDVGAVYCVNSEATHQAPLPLLWNSPDLNGDMVVNLQDAGLLATDLMAGYHFRSDLVYDGVLNVADVGAFVAALGASCP